MKFVYKISACLKISQTVYEFQGHYNFFAQCALVASQREIDMKDIIGHYELLSVCRSFMVSGRELNHGIEAKSKLIDALTKHVRQSKIPASECPATNTMAADKKVSRKCQNQCQWKPLKTFVFSGCGRAQFDSPNCSVQ